MYRHQNTHIDEDKGILYLLVTSLIDKAVKGFPLQRRQSVGKKPSYLEAEFQFDGDK